MQHQQPADPSCLNGFRIYVGLLIRLTDMRGTNRLNAALARLWPCCTPTRIMGWCTDARPRDWRNHQFFVDQSVMYSILDKCAHYHLHFSPAIPTTAATGATRMTLIRARAALEFSPILRRDHSLPQRYATCYVLCLRLKIEPRMTSQSSPPLCGLYNSSESDARASSGLRTSTKGPPPISATSSTLRTFLA